MVPEFTLKLVTICDAYFTFSEFGELAELFGVEVDSSLKHDPTWLSPCKWVTGQLEHGSTRSFIDNLLDLAEAKNNDAVAHQTWERRDFHVSLTPVLVQARELLSGTGSPSELTVAAGHSFTAKSKVRELLAAATTDLLVIDPYVGLGTLDCLRDVSVPVRLLAADHAQALEKDFERVLETFCSEGHDLTVRRAAALHDRHLVFNDRCWLVGSSLKDAGKKPFNCIEILDKAALVADLESRWAGATKFP